LDQNQNTSSSGKWVRLIIKLVFAIIILALLSLYVLNASKPGRNPEFCPAACATSNERNPGPLRMVSLNMLHGFPKFKVLPLRTSLIAVFGF
jgi:hypothetical protein